MSLNLVYDRTEEDETSAAAIRSAYQKLGNWSGLTDAERAQLERGALTYNTLNRVEQTVKTLAAALTSAGYPVEVTPVMKGTARVPEGYTEVEYIESSGTQYIDTGFKPNQETKMSLNMAFLSAAGENVAGTRNSSSDTTNRFGIVTFGSASKIGSMFRGTATQGIPVDTATHSYTLSKSGLTVDGVSYGGADSGTFACTYPVILCGWNNGSNGIAPNKSRIVSCDIYAGGALARQFVPCKNPDGTVGLYDLVGGQFYTTPLAEEPVELPDGYTQVSYLQATGTQYLDTGLTCNQSDNYKIELDCDLTSSAYYAGANGYLQYQASIASGSRSHLTITYANKVETITVNGAVKKTDDWSSFSDTNVKIGILRLGAANNGWYSSAPQSGKIYSCKIYKGGVLVRDMIPARNSVGTLGLYDTVNGTFYANAGSGTFTAGTDIVGFAAGAEIGTVEDREWREGDILYRPQWTTYLSNVQRLRDAYYTLASTGELPTPGAKLGYQGANTIEKVLADIDLLLDGMKSIYRRAGTFTAGGNYLRQLIRSI